ncbi:hypothetical protein BJ741DRAFT_638417 [Chytriomyces cf. hyalinus JEL632]|nr:hypothetical protein BJ741DRAFT_638417 [Chytriomyces cf. hyalinus JEL632]
MPPTASIPIVLPVVVPIRKSSLSCMTSTTASQKQLPARTHASKTLPIETHKQRPLPPRTHASKSMPTNAQPPRPTLFIRHADQQDATVPPLLHPYDPLERRRGSDSSTSPSLLETCTDLMSEIAQLLSSQDSQAIDSVQQKPTLVHSSGHKFFMPRPRLNSESMVPSPTQEHFASLTLTTRSNSNPLRKPSNLLKNETLVQQESQYGHNLNYEALGDYEPVQDRASYMSMSFERSLARSFEEHEQTRGDTNVSDTSRGSRRRQSSVESNGLLES